MDKLGLQEGTDGYVWKIREDSGKITTIQVSPFLVQPKERIVCDDYCETVVDILYEKKKYETTLSVKDFSTASSFREAIARKVNPYVWYDVKPKSHQKLLKLMENYDIKETKGINFSGFIKHKGDWCYSTAHATLTKNKELINDIKILDDYKDLDNKGILLENPIETKDIAKIKNSLINFNEIGVSASVIGYTASMFLKERLWTELDLKFPIMAMIGTAGCGKSATLENVILPILSMNQNQILSAFQTTKFTLLKLSSCSNTCPLIINEYKPNELPLYIMNDLNNLINNNYDRYSNRRGRADLSMVSYDYRSPLILMGEGYTADQSKKDRFIRLYPSLEEKEKYTKDFENLKANNHILKMLGKQLLLNALNISKEQLQAYQSKNIEYIKLSEKGKKIKQDRGVINLSIVLTGIDFINEIVKYSDKQIEMLKNATIETYVNDTLEGELNQRTAVHSMLEYINQLAYEGKIIAGIDYLYKPKENALCLDIPNIFSSLDVDSKNKNSKPQLSQKDFTMQLRKEKMFKDYKAVRIPSKNTKRRCYIIDVLNPIFKNIEMSSLVQCDSDEKVVNLKACN